MEASDNPLTWCVWVTLTPEWQPLRPHGKIRKRLTSGTHLAPSSHGKGVEWEVG